MDNISAYGGHGTSIGNVSFEELEGEQDHRELRYAKNKIHWFECVEDKLTEA
jgi:hypothetical protein